MIKLVIYPIVILDTTQQKLDKYFQLLDAWNGRYNLIGKSMTKNKILNQSSLMLSVSKDKLGLSKDSLVLDIGSGAGLPSIIWCILEDIPVCIVELSHTRCSFLRFCAQQLDINLRVECCDIKKFQWSNEMGKVVQNNLIITAQAFASVKNILVYTDHLRYTDTKMVLLKSAQLPEELKEAEKNYAFHENISSSEYGYVLTLEKIIRK